MKGVLIAGMVLLFAAGCVSNANIKGNATGTMFVYKPGPAVEGGPKVPVKVAVLPFKDGTEDFTRRGSVFDAESLVFNLAKSGIDGFINAMTPELWAKAFADDMAASGAFRSVRFVYGPSDLQDEAFLVEGTLEKAYAAGGWTRPSEYALRIRAVRRADNRPVWDKEVTKGIMSRKSDFDGCGTNRQCMVERSHAAMNMVMQEMFAVAREDLVRTIGPPPGSGTEGGDFPFSPSAAGEAARPVPSKSPAPESVEDTIERILKGK
jgi:hypothetical protein